MNLNWIDTTGIPIIMIIWYHQFIFFIIPNPWLSIRREKVSPMMMKSNWQGTIIHDRGTVMFRLARHGVIRAHFLSLAQSKLRLCLANHRAGYFSNLACDWLSIVWAYSKEETENGPRFGKSPKGLKQNWQKGSRDLDCMNKLLAEL